MDTSTKNNGSEDISIAIEPANHDRKRTESINKKYPINARQYFDFKPINVHIHTATINPFSIECLTGLIVHGSVIEPDQFEKNVPVTPENINIRADTAKNPTKSLISSLILALYRRCIRYDVEKIATNPKT